MSARIKPTVNNIINLWFSVDTPLRQHKIRLNTELWKTCQRISQELHNPVAQRTTGGYRKMDKVAFAKAVQLELERRQILSPANA